MKIPSKVLDVLLAQHAGLGRLLETQWVRNPFGVTPHATEDFYLAEHERAKGVESEVASQIEAETGFAIDASFFHHLAKYTQIVKKKSAINYSHGRVLYSLLRQHIAERGMSHLNVIETGTARGFSALCMAKAFEDAGVTGTVISIDLTSHHRQQIWNSIDDHEGPKSRREIVSRWPDLVKNIIFLQGSSSLLLDRVGVSSFDFAFLDAQHIRSAVLNEFNAVQKLQTKGDKIVFDDVTPSLFPGVCEAVNKVEADGNYHIRRIMSSQDRGYAIATKLV